MARIRYLKPEFFEDEDIASLPYWVRLLFQGLWVLADKEGRLEDRPSRIHIKIFPYEPKIDIEKGLEILTRPKKYSPRPFIIRYQVNGERYIQIVNWKKHQRPHHTEKESEIPEPQEDTKNNGYLTVKERLSNGECQEGIGMGKGMGKGMEKGMGNNIYMSFEKDIFATYNSLSKQHPIIPPLKSISAERRRKLKARFSDKGFRENWRDALKKVPEYPFLLGENDRKWTFNFDWFIKNDTNYLKILEGRYKKVKSQKEINAELEEKYKKIMGGK